MENHGLKDVHIKPYNILESANSLKVYDLCVSKRMNASRNDAKDLFMLYKHLFVEQTNVSHSGALPSNMAGSRAKQPGRGDLWDLATFIYWLCTRERLFEEEDDFDYFVMTKQVTAWMNQREKYLNQQIRNSQSSNAQ